jgi:predicted Fe-Mo cluster-binding NifX family protein
MKIGITSQGNRVDSSLDPHFGRAAFLIIIDTETRQTEIVDNGASQNAVQGAGIQTARNMADQKVAAVVSGHVGPKALTVLQAAGIPVYCATSGTVQEVFNAYLTGQLKPQSQADTEGPRA